MKKKNKYRFLFVFLSFCFFSSLQAQDLDQRISIHFRETSLGDILTAISRLGNINFSYSPQQIPVNQKITVRFNRKPVRLILKEILDKQGIEYAIFENQIVLRMRSQGKEEPVNAVHSSFTISGFVRDKATGEALIGANVYDGKTFTGTTVNAYGFYSLTLPQGSHEIVCSFIGHEKESQAIFLKSDQRIYFDLQEIHIDIKEVEVFSGEKPGSFSAAGNGGFRLSPEMLSQMPVFGGEPDVIKSLQVIPGIHSFGDGSALFYVRGGNSDQNLILIDEAPIYNPSHLFGFFSVLAPDAIREAEVYKGDFPSNYGGRLSSVIDIKAKNGNLKRFGFSGNVGPYASSLSLEGPIVKDKGSFFLSGRVSTINWLKFLNTTSTLFDIQFYDINAKLNYRINGNNRVFLTFYYGDDLFNRTTGNSISTYGISWDNLAGTFRWNHTFSSRLFSNTTVYYSRYQYFLYTSHEQNNFWTSSIANLAGKTDFTWYLNPNNTLKAGFEAAFHKSNPGNVNFSFSTNEEEKPVIPLYRSMEYTVYLGNEQKAGKHFTFRYGIRLPLWEDLGPTSVFYFDVRHQVIDTVNVDGSSVYAWYFSPEPRVNIIYTPDKNNALKFNYSRNTQFLQVLSASTSPFTSLEVWAPTGPNIQPRTSDQLSVGYSRMLHQSMFLFSLEGFYKWFHNNIDYEDHANMLYNPLLEGELRFGKAWSYGLELLLRKQEGKLTGWIAYTFSRAFIQTPEINGGEVYPAFYDRPHDLCINLSYRTGQHWNFSGNWILVSGAAITTPIGFYYSNGYSVPIYGKKNNDRLPVYHRLDLSVGYTFNKPGNRFQHSLVLTVYNAYGRNNPFSVNFNRTGDDGDFVVPGNMNIANELVPTTISVAGMIPSINYQFKF